MYANLSGKMPGITQVDFLINASRRAVLEHLGTQFLGLIYSKNLLGSKHDVIALCLFLNLPFFQFQAQCFWPASASLALAALHHGQVPILAPVNIWCTFCGSYIFSEPIGVKEGHP